MRRTRTLLFGVLLALVPSTPAMASTPEIAATLDGRSIPAAEVAAHHCHDLEFPLIRCFRKVADRDASVSVETGAVQLAVAAAVVYVTIYDLSGFFGSSMSISQNYDTLSVVGWNDRASSFKGRNSETGRFYVDWFHGGSSWAFCCNQQTANLGSYDNTFTSVYRT
ncbi:MAG TPA: hypothetical protein VGQ02_09915 [Candidatus Limnocylindrales bacterium]|nr:hypothetical protein [Candidatus Limnocylindrales bacterium]